MSDDLTKRVYSDSKSTKPVPETDLQIKMYHYWCPTCNNTRELHYKDERLPCDNCGSIYQILNP